MEMPPLQSSEAYLSCLAIHMGWSSVVFLLRSLHEPHLPHLVHTLVEYGGAILSINLKLVCHAW